MSVKNRIKKLIVGDLAANCYILETDCANIIIDAGAQPEMIEKYLNSEKITPDFLISTHGHYDHIGAVEEIRSNYKIPFFIHEHDEPLITDPMKNMSSFLVEKGLILKTYNLIDDKSSSFFDKYGLKIIHTPGHTPGSIMVMYQDFLFTGDFLFKCSIGRTDLPEGDIKIIKKSLTMLKNNKSLNPKLNVLPGHGENTTLGYEFKNNYFLNNDYLREVD